MIFCTAGTQVPFDRFLKIIDELAADLDEEVVAQATKGHYKPKNIRYVKFLPPNEFNELFSKARLVIAHAGMGTIISAMLQQKPLIIFPRVAALGEHRNEHQLATAQKMKELGYVYVANDADELRELVLRTELKPLHRIGDYASQSFVGGLCDLIGSSTSENKSLLRLPSRFHLPFVNLLKRKPRKKK